MNHCPKPGRRLGGVGAFGVVACGQEVAVTPGNAPERLKAEG